MVNIPQALPQPERLKIDTTTLIDPNKHFNFIKNECFGGRAFEMKRIFSGSQNGFTAAEFHCLVDNNDHIMYIIKSEHDRTFGGYCSVKLQPSKSGYFEDKLAFMIQLDDQKLFKVNKTGSANYYNSSIILSIGGANDIYIADNCNQNQESLTYFPCQYYGPEGTTSMTEETKKYLAGSYNFKVKEIEVFHLNFQ